LPYNATRIDAGTGVDLQVLFGAQPAQSLAAYRDIDPQRCADIRASWAAHGVIAYAEYVAGELHCEIASVISDLLCDLQHLCDGLGVYFGQAVNVARRCHDEEVNER